jgi:hypothetical protein
MSHPFHSLLPLYLQSELREATPRNLDSVVKSMQDTHPQFFQNDKTLNDRVFLNEPRGHIYGGTFIHPAPAKKYEGEK